MRDTYKPSFWSSDYVLTQEDDIDPMESDEALEEYIERRRHEFQDEWNEYQSKAYD